MLSESFVEYLKARPEMASQHACWLAAVRSSLKRDDVESLLVSHTLDGLRVEALYPAAEPRPPVLRRNSGPWRISQRVDHPDADAVQFQALDDLENGADALTIVLEGSLAARQFGLPATRSAIEQALSGVRLDLISLRLDAGGNGLLAAEALVAIAEGRDHALGVLELDLGVDPIGTMAASARCPGDLAVISRQLAGLVADLDARGLNGSVLMADGRCYHEAGATEAQELAGVLATGVAYLRALQAHGIPLDTARRSIAFLLTVDADQFLGIAKLRALRRLWSRVEEACGLAPKPIRLHAESAWRMFTQRDPWVNILRTTTATFSAGIGGADVVTVLPFSSALGLPDRFARRVARNLQIVLLEEAHLGRVADPVAGAGAFEALTNELAGEAWRQFQAIEQAGGILASLRSGTLQSSIARARDVRAAAIATRRLPLTGTSEFPDINERSVLVLMPAGIGGPATMMPWPNAPIAIAPLPSQRLSVPFERLRDASDQQAATTSKRRRVFLATLGPVAAYSERAIFAKNAFEAVGIETVQPAHGDQVLDLAASFLASGADMACLCSSDAVYEAEAASAAQDLRRAGAVSLLLCGLRTAAFERAGITHFLERGSDLFELLPKA